ncbi:MAG: hypothetical protein WAO55_05625 [Candidatus Manganitrophaceae bacterium]
MTALHSYLKVRLKSLVRIWTDDWMTYFLLGPVMVGAVFLLGRRIFHDFSFSAGEGEPFSLSTESMGQLALVSLALKVFFNFLPLSKRLYPTEQSLTIEDLLPIRSEIRYLMFYVEQWIKDLPFFLFALFVVLFLDKPNLIGWVFTIWLFFPGVEIGLTLLWNHLRPPNRSELSLVLILLVWLIWFLPIGTFGWWIDFVTPFLVTIGFWGIGKWRYQDLTGVEQLLLEAEPAVNPFRRIGRYFPKLLRSLMIRDLILTLRNFAPLFWRNLALAMLSVAAVAVRGKVAVAVLCGVAVYFLSLTAAHLFVLQRPYRESDRVLPLPLERIWHGKVIYAIFLSLPIPLLVWGLEMIVQPRPPLSGLFLLVQLILVGLAVAALTAGTICEGDQKPALHAIISGFLSALATLFVGAFHPLLFVLIFPVLNNLRGSAVTRLENEEAA